MPPSKGPRTKLGYDNVYEGFDDAKTKATQVLFQVQIQTKKTKIKKKTKS